MQILLIVLNLNSVKSVNACNKRSNISRLFLNKLKFGNSFEKNKAENITRKKKD